MVRYVPERVVRQQQAARGSGPLLGVEAVDPKIILPPSIQISPNVQPSIQSSIYPSNTDELVPGYVAVIVSVTAVLLMGAYV